MNFRRIESGGCVLHEILPDTVASTAGLPLISHTIKKQNKKLSSREKP
jgi:hypothetical protein